MHNSESRTVTEFINMWFSYAGHWKEMGGFFSTQIIFHDSLNFSMQQDKNKL